jgi:hypothetical protein
MRARARFLAPLALAVALAPGAACNGADADTGDDAEMQIAGAQFVRGAMPEGEAGPKVAGVTLVTTTLRIGTVGKPIVGALDPGGAAALLQLGGDRGYWILSAGVPDVATPGFPSFHASASFARGVAPGPHDLVLRAVDAAGNVGPARVESLTAIDPSIPEGRMVVSLSWDSEADLDLHVVLPDGVEVYNRNINSYEPPPPGQAPDPTAYQHGAVLDADSNAQCQIDGRRRENVVWKDPPAPGHYVVRVDTFSMCGEISAHWTVDVLADGQSIGRATGTALPVDTRFNHDRGAGVLALELDRP